MGSSFSLPFPIGGMFFKHTTQPYGAVFTRPRQPAPGHRPVQRKTADPSEPFQRLFSMPENLAFRREASHDLAIMSMPFTPPYATEKAWALPVRHPCCPYQTIHLGRFTVGNPLHFAETPLPALREDRLFLPLIFRFTKEYFHKPLFLRNRIDTRPMLD